MDKSAKKILMLLEGQLQEDERVMKSALSLCQAGFQVHVLYPAGNSVNESISGIYGHSFGVNKQLFNKLLGTCLLHPFYFNLWMKSIVRHIPDLNTFDAVYVHDLPLSRVGASLKSRYGMKLICDQHEYYTDWIRQTHHMNTGIGRIVSRLSDWDAYEAKYLNKADLVVSVLEPLCELYRNKYPGLKDKVVNLPNTPAGSIYRDFSPNESISALYRQGKQYRAIYIGAQLTRERRLDLMIDAIPTIVSKLPDFRFMVLGREHRSYDIRGHIERLGIAEYVEMVGRVPFEEIPDYLACSSLGINVHDLNAGREVHESIFTKVYQYLGMHNAVLSTELRAMADLIRRYNIGEVVESSPEAIAQSVIRVLGDQEMLGIYIKNTYQIKDFFWEDSSGTWLERINFLMS